MRLDGNEIRISVMDISECDVILNDPIKFTESLMKMVQERRDSLVLCNERFEKYVQWWNSEIVPSVLTMDWMLVRQEIRMWIQLGKPVGIDEIEWMSVRRGFTDHQKEAIIDGLKLVGLYTDKLTMDSNLYIDTADSESVKKMADVVGYEESNG